MPGAPPIVQRASPSPHTLISQNTVDPRRVLLTQIGLGRFQSGPKQPVTLDDHSKVVPRLPIPNRTVKRLCADDSWHSPVKVGHRQALTPQSPCIHSMQGLCPLCAPHIRADPFPHASPPLPTGRTAQRRPGGAQAAPAPRGRVRPLAHAAGYTRGSDRPAPAAAPPPTRPAPGDPPSSVRSARSAPPDRSKS